MLSAKEKRLLEQIEPVVENDGFEVVTVEIVGSKRAPIIRVYIDVPEGEGVTFDVLSRAQVSINALLDEIDPFPGAYTLEVSSPGIDRPLRTPAHFRRFVGSKVQIKCAQTIDGCGRFKGVLTHADDSSVFVECDGETFEIPFEQISRAHVVGEINFG